MRILALALALCLLPGAAGADTAASALVPFASPESIQRLARSQHKVDFFHLANHFESQSNKAFCGPTSSVIVLNALRSDNDRIAKPEDPSLLGDDVKKLVPPGFDPLFHRYTQNDFFTPEVEQVKSRLEVFGKPRAPKGNGAPGGAVRPDPGIQLRQLAAMLTAHGLEVAARVVDDRLEEATIRRELTDNLGTEGNYVIINYHRPALGQAGGGHISPLAAYDQASDSFLILDVNPNGQTWVWAPAAALIKAMRTKDVVENRGYLLIKEASR
ncbi:MAG TPA: phytochelatin synthase family protein [Polyangia bacterium]|jgi:hypothetical protein|nr:phytochelatin synthase family protein [Polyangia bacterium]